MRTAFIQELIAHARKNPRIFLVVGDLGYSVVEPFAKEFPDRFLNAGVAEQNMTGVAAGLASEGFHVFTYSIANFPTLRCLEQIRNDICYHELPVTIVAVGGGLSYGNLGYSHHAVEDFAVMRAIPGMRICAPGDSVETKGILGYLVNNPQQSYLRLGKSDEPNVHNKEVRIFPGQLLFIDKRQNNNLLLSTGSMLFTAFDFLNNTKRNWSLASLPTWSESDKTAIAQQISHFKKVVTIEDHLRAGGFGSFIAEIIDDFGFNSIDHRSLSLDFKVCGMVGEQKTLNIQGGLSHSRLASLVE